MRISSFAITGSIEIAPDESDSKQITRQSWLKIYCIQNARFIYGIAHEYPYCEIKNHYQSYSESEGNQYR